MQQLQALSLQRRAELANACDIAARSIKAGNEAQLDRSMPPEKTTMRTAVHKQHATTAARYEISQVPMRSFCT